MKTERHTMPEHDVVINDRWGNPTVHHFEAYEYTYAPTLAKVHKWLSGDWGPFYLSWKDGELCPFNPQVGSKNMRCVDGSRGVNRCPGIGLLIRPQDVNHLDANTQRRIVGRVICYEWCHRLNNAYWDIPQDELLAMPDDPRQTAILIMRRVFRESGWFAWRRELKARQHKRKWDWLKPLETRR